MNCVNGTGAPIAPPSNTGLIIVVTGCSFTSPFISVKRPFNCRHTNLWSTDTVGNRSTLMPVSNVLFSGTITTWPLTVSHFTPVTNDCVSPTWMQAVWPFSAVSFVADHTFDGQS